MDGVWFEIVIIVLLVLANGVFSMAEISVVAARKVRLQQRAEEGDHRAKVALDLAQDPAQFLSTVQVGITLIGILAGAYGGATISEPLAAVIAGFPDLAPYAEGIALGVVVACITLLSLILGELVPKNIGLQYPESIASWVAGPMMMLARVGGPIVRTITASTSLIMRIFGVKGDAEVGVDGRRDPRGDQRRRRSRRARARRGDDRSAGVPTRRPACRRDHVAADRHRVGGRRHHQRRAARVPRVAQPHRIRGVR